MNDDNDNIQVTLDGYVPNICYSAVTPVFTINRDLKVIQVEQYAVKKPIQGCSDDEILTNGFNFPAKALRVEIFQPSENERGQRPPSGILRAECAYIHHFGRAGADMHHHKWGK